MKNLRNTLQIFIRGFTALLAVCLLALFALDSYFYNNPITHERNPIVGRIFEHSVKFGSQIYLTQREHEPYVWVYIALIACGVLSAGLAITDIIVEKKMRARSGGVP